MPEIPPVLMQARRTFERDELMFLALNFWLGFIYNSILKNAYRLPYINKCLYNFKIQALTRGQSRNFGSSV